MAKKKEKKDTMTGVAMSGIMGVTMTGAVSSATGYGAGISSSYATGVSNVGKVLPVYGKVKGTTRLRSPYNPYPRSRR